MRSIPAPHCKTSWRNVLPPPSWQAFQAKIAAKEGPQNYCRGMKHRTSRYHHKRERPPLQN